MIRGYLATFFFDIFGYEGTERLAERIRKETGIALYVPQENKSINDKSKEGITAVDIFNADVDRLKNTDLLIALIDGVEIDSGVSAEIGYFSAMMEYERTHVISVRPKKIIGLYTDIRKFGDGDNRMYKNLFTKGAILRNGELAYTVDELIEYIVAYIKTLKIEN